MAISARGPYENAIAHLARYIRESGRPLRDVAGMTLGLEAPDRVFHSQLIPALKLRPSRSLSLRQCLVLLNVLGLPHLALFLDGDSESVREAAQIAERALLMAADDRAELLKKMPKPVTARKRRGE